MSKQENTILLEVNILHNSIWGDVAAMIDCFLELTRAARMHATGLQNNIMEERKWKSKNQVRQVPQEICLWGSGSYAAE